MKTGKTPVLTAGETRALLDAIDTGTLVGVSDRALIGLMVYSFARVSAAVAMRVSDYYTQGKRSFFRLHEKGGKYLVVPAHHVGQAYIDEYIERVSIVRTGPPARCFIAQRNDASDSAEDDQATCGQSRLT